MYEIFKVLLEAAEQIGSIKNIDVHEDDRIWPDGVKISGTTADGHEFELELSITMEDPEDE